jgi:hypothetical protein
MIRGALLAALLAACTTPPPAKPLPAWSQGPALPLARLEPGVTALGQQLVVAGGFAPSASGGLAITGEIDLLDTTTCADPTAASCKWTASAFPDLPVPVHHAQIAAVGTALYALGGLGAPDANNNYPASGAVYRLDTLDTPLAWTGPADGVAQIPAGYERGSAGVVVVAQRIYLFGGASTTSALASVIYYDTSTNTWCPGLAGCDQAPDLPAPRSHPAAMRRVDGTLVVAGGLSGLTADTAVPDVYVLAAGATAWLPGKPMPLARGGCAYGVVTGDLACAGGEASTSALKVTESYDAINDMWMCPTDDMATGCTPTKQLAEMPQSTAGTQGAAIADRLYVPGGSRTLPSVLTGFAPTDTLFVLSPLDTAAAQ